MWLVCAGKDKVKNFREELEVMKRLLEILELKENLIVEIENFMNYMERIINEVEG